MASNDVFTIAAQGDVKGLVAFVKSDSKKAVLDARDDNGNSALHVAVMNKKKVMVQALLKLKIDVNVQNNSGDTALLLAVGGKVTDCASELIKAGADATIKNGEGVDAATLLKEAKAAKEGGTAPAPAAAPPAATTDAETAEATPAPPPEATPASPPEEDVAPVVISDDYPGPKRALECVTQPTGATLRNRQKALKEVTFRQPWTSPPSSSAAKIIITMTQPACYTKKVAVPSDYTVNDLLNLYAEKIELQLVQPFCLVELVMSGGAQRISLDTECTERCLDMYKTLAEEGIQKDAFIMIRPVLYKSLRDTNQDPVATAIHLQMVRRDLVLGTFDCYELVAVTLAALFVQFDLGDFNANIHKVGYFNDTIHTMLPKKTIKYNSSKRLQKRILHAYRKLKGTPKNVAAQQYMELVRTLPAYGAARFPCTMGDEKGEVGLAEDGVMLRIAGDSWNLYPFNHISAVYKLSSAIQIHTESSEEEMVIEFSPAPEDVPAVMEKLQVYYTLLLLSDDPVKYCSLTSIDMPKEECPPGSLFSLPVARSLDQPYYSRAAHFKAEYQRMCQKLGLEQLEDMLEALEEAEDSGQNYGDLNLIGFDQNIQQLEAISKALNASHSFVPYFPEQFMENMEIKNINFSKCNLGKNREAFNRVCHFVNSGFSGIDLSICKFDISDNALKEDMYIQLSSALKVMSPLISLDVSGNVLSEDGLNGLLSGLSEQFGHATEVLTMNNCQLGDRAAHFLGNRLYSSNTLQRVDVADNKMGDSGTMECLEALKKSRSIVEINLSNNTMGSKANKELVEILSGTIRCRSWILNHCKVKGTCTEPFAEQIKKNVVWNVELNDNALGSKACSVLVEALAETQSLVRLSLDGNKLDKSFGLALADAIKTNRSLEFCSLRRNGLGNAGATALFDCLNTNHVLKVLNLADNKIDAKACQAIESALRKNGTIEEVDLSHNKLTDDGVQMFAQGLSNDRMYLKRLRLDNVKMGDLGLIALSTALLSNTRLLSISLGSNKITAEGTSAFFQTLDQNKTIEKVEVLDVDRSASDVIKRASQNPELVCEVVYDE